MKFIKALIAFAFCAHTAAALADPPAQVGRLSYLQGTVSFDAADTSNDWMAAQLNWPVTTGDRLWTDRDGRAEMRIGSTAIRAGALTSVDVLRLDDSGTQLRLAQGTLNVRLRQLDPGDSFEISTPAGAVLLTRPGNYRVAVDPNGAATAVLVRQGQADVLTGNTPVIVRDNQSVTLSANGQDLAGAPAPDEFEQWALARDGQDERVVATRYVSPAMTGHEELDQHGTWQSEPQYGNVWIPAATALPVGWAPYRHGRWVWVSPWGWTWVDNAPWGFAPYHYGRWVWLGNRWAWAPGTRVVRPVYAPALVAFVGGNNWSVAVGSGPAVGWVPLGWREPYIPWYRYSPAYVRNVNVTHVTNINVINHYSSTTNVTRIRYVNREVPSATTVVARDTFVSARPVHQARLAVPDHALAGAHVTHALPVTRPVARHSLIAEQPGARLPAAIAAREVVAARAPLAPARFAPEGGRGVAPRAGADERPRVRVVTTQPPGAAPRVHEPAAPAPRMREPAAGAPRVHEPAAGEREGAPERGRAPQVFRAQGVAPQAAPGGAVEPPQGARLRVPERAPQPHPETRLPEAPHAPAVAAPRSVAPAVSPDAQRLQQERAAQQAAQQKQLQDQRAQQQLQERQARAEQQRQAHALQQQHLQQQKEQQHQIQQQRAAAVQQQRELQMQQAQQVEQQRRAQRQQHREESAAARRPPPPQEPPPAQGRAARPKPEPERPPQGR